MSSLYKNETIISCYQLWLNCLLEIYLKGNSDDPEKRAIYWQIIKSRMVRIGRSGWGGMKTISGIITSPGLRASPTHQSNDGKSSHYCDVSGMKTVCIGPNLEQNTPSFPHTNYTIVYLWLSSYYVKCLLNHCFFRKERIFHSYFEDFNHLLTYNCLLLVFIKVDSKLRF